ncbi:MAG: hypothetical protein IJ571_08670 [Ruminococcus sp.]|nr:hypothetical protein [Ruminococcus sp.]
MKKLLKHLSPLAPDDSGACSVLYEMGAVTVICDAGGCAGNVCGFDEPRWFTKRSALFSAGLRDMDAILGRDELLVKKLSLICEQVDARFTAIVGTPVPAVIATDMRAIERMAEKRTGLPCIALNTDGTNLYDYGEEMVYKRLFEQFVSDEYSTVKGRVGVLGATPLNTGELTSDRIKGELRSEYGTDVVCFGLDSGIDDIIRACECEKIVVIAPSGLAIARFLNKKYGIPYDVSGCCIDKNVLEAAKALDNKKVLIIHQQFTADYLREQLSGCDVTCASWFKMVASYKQENDVHIKGEDQFIELVENGDFDVIIADSFFKRALNTFKGEWIDLPHFAVSGRLNKDI